MGYLAGPGMRSDSPDLHGNLASRIAAELRAMCSRNFLALDRKKLGPEAARELLSITHAAGVCPWGSMYEKSAYFGPQCM